MISPRVIGPTAGILLCGALGVPAREASAQESLQADSAAAAPGVDLDEAKTAARLRRFEREPGAYIRVFASAAAGFGVRFNNPYRLETQIGDDAASGSITSPYLDFALSMLGGPPNGLQHGASAHIGTSLTGVIQPYVTPSYVLAYRASLPVLLYGRIGTPILLAPDVNVGAELAASASYFFNAGLGLTSEIAFDLFYGAATLEQKYSVIPVLCFQLGLIADYEFLP